MSLYYRNLKRIGICVILVSIANLVYELLIRRYLAETVRPLLEENKNLLGAKAEINV